MADDEQAPEPGHFLPGGGGGGSEAAPTSVARTSLTSPETANRRQLGMSKPRPVGESPDPAAKKATPLASDPEYQGGYSGPPAAPLAGAPVTPLGGTRRIVRARPVTWRDTSPRRTGIPQYAPQPPRTPLSSTVVILLCALALVVVGGGTFASYRAIDSFDNTAANPFTKPPGKRAESPQPAPPQPTETVTIQPVPDLVRLQKNKIYTVGKIPTVGCPMPNVKPNSKVNVLRFYQALMPCLNETWEPLVLKADYPFRQPKLALAAKGASGSCGGEPPETSFYCPKDETIYMKWEYEVKLYKLGPTAVVELLDTMAHEYSHHVQHLTNITISSDSQEGWTKGKDAKLEWSRRLELQASCLGSAFLSSNKKSFGLQGQRLRYWDYEAKHTGDENNPKGPRDHGSRKSYELWMTQGFKTADPASCNTYTAPAAKVS